MEKDSVKRLILISSFILFAIAMIFVSYYIVHNYNGNNQYFQAYNKLIDNDLANLIAKQKSMDAKIEEIKENGDYTIESPCIIVNPYDINPLSALVIFNTKEKRSVDVYINDTKVTKVEASTEHVIPVYGLYANSINYVDLKLDNGTSKTIEIKTTSYNNNISGINFKEERKDYTHTFVLGNFQSSKSIFRGFDSYDNLILYMDFGYMSSIKYGADRFHIGYNSEYSRETKLVDLELQVDYMGRILAITKNTSELDHSYNAEVGDKKYNYKFMNLYKDKISNYKTPKLVDNVGFSAETKIETTNIEDKLVNAELYKNKYLLAVNGEYITFEFDENTSKMNLVLVTRNTDYSYMYSLNNKNIIKTKINGDVSLYLENNGTYYSLLTTINN